VHIDQRHIWQIGIVVDDIELAATEILQVLGLEFTEPVARSYGGNDIRVGLSLTGPPYFELIEGNGGGPWDGHTGSRLDHLAYFVDDLEAERERLVAEGCPVIVESAALGMVANYHLLPRTNIRVEAVDAAFKTRIRDAYGLGDVDGRWHRTGPWQLGFMVDDVAVAQDELSRALGLKWTPVRLFGQDGEVTVCMSVQGPPYFELVQAGIGSDLYWRGGPRFDHLAYWADELRSESARLSSVGAPLVQTARQDAILFHHAPRSGIRLEVIAAEYRHTIRTGWGLQDVG
jgi:hypothetical protein